MRQLSKKPEGRPESAAALAREISVLLRGTPAGTSSPRGAIRIALLVMGLIGAGALAAFFGLPPSDSPDADSNAHTGMGDMGMGAVLEDLGEALIQDAGTSTAPLDAGLLAEDAGADAGAEDAGGLLFEAPDGVALIELERQGFGEDANFEPLIKHLQKPLLDCFELSGEGAQVVLRFSIQRSSTSFSVSPENEQLRRCVAINLPQRLRWPEQRESAAVYTISIRPGS